MSFENILVANIGWSEDYSGQKVSSAMSYVLKHGTGAEAYNFDRTRDGMFYGYVRGGTRLSERNDRLWTIVFVSKPVESAALRVVGWYENTVVGGYSSRPEYIYDATFPKLTSREHFVFCAITANAFITQAEDRASLILPKGHRIKSGGLYFAAGEEIVGDTPLQLASRLTMAKWVSSVLPGLRDASRLGGDGIITTETVPGIQIDDGGSPSGFSPVAESDEHRKLRLWACSNSEFFTGLEGVIGNTEFALPSGDRVDAVFDTLNGLWLIEAKSRKSAERDLVRGIYQCVKYRAVAAAVDGYATRQRPIHAILLTEQDLSPRLRELADHHGVIYLQHQF